MNKTQSGAFGNRSRYANAATTPGGTKGPWTVTVINKNPDMGTIRIQGTPYVDPVAPTSGEFVSIETNKKQYANMSVSDNGSGKLQVRFADGASIKIDAIAKSGYEFVAFTEGSKTYASPYSATVRGDITIYASFKKSAVQTFTVAVSANDAKMGTVSGGGTYAKGTSIRVKAEPKEGYKFVRWEGDKNFAGNVPGSNSPSFTFTVDRNIDLVAIFEASAGKSDDPEPGNGGGGYSGGGGGYSGEDSIGDAPVAEGTDPKGKAIAFVKKNWIILLVAAVVLYKLYKSKGK